MRKILTALLVIHFCTWACKPAPQRQEAQRPDTLKLPAADTMIAAEDTIMAREVTSWKRFEDYAGRYAGEVDLLEQEPLKSRFKELLHRDTLAFIQRYQVAPPIALEDGVLYNDGCKPHECSSNEAALAIDMNRDVLYVGIAINGKARLYREKQDSAYPQRLLDWKRKFN